MAVENNPKFEWGKFLRSIKYNNVIPIIGKQLYRVNIEAENKSDYLYKHLTEVVYRECKLKPSPKDAHKFPIVSKEYLDENIKDYTKLSELLMTQCKRIQLEPESHIWKLARIKGFDFFLNTTYDDFLLQTLRRVRQSGSDSFFYMKNEPKYFTSAGTELVSIPNSNPTLVFHLFGHFKNMVPAYTDQSIVEAMLSFHKNFERPEPELTNLIKRMVNKQLLFLGFEYDDWLFRYLLCNMSRIAYELKNETLGMKLLIGNNFENSPPGPFQQLLQFLRIHGAVDFYPNENFVDDLFKEMEKNYPDEIVKPEDFPGTVFISFEGKDRVEARELAHALRKDGIDVWLDEDRLGGGDEVNQTIIKAINKCRAFIPITSLNSTQISENGEIKYHIKEWEWALYKKSLNQEFEIIPGILDSKDNMYKKFEDFKGYNIPNGTDGEYEKLRNKLQEIQEKYHE